MFTCESDMPQLTSSSLFGSENKFKIQWSSLYLRHRTISRRSNIFCIWNSSTVSSHLTLFLLIIDNVNMKIKLVV